jgi:5-hydroxyisourate hydrolase
MITTHILDTARGRPAAGVPVQLDRLDGDFWRTIGHDVTNDDGRARGLTAGEVAPGTYRLRFETGVYLGEGAFYPFVEVVFTVQGPGGHYHVPLLLSPVGYSTYRGS